MLDDTVYLWAQGIDAWEPAFLAYDAGEDRWDELPLPPDGGDAWWHLEAGDVVAWDPGWFAVDGRVVNPTPGGTDGGDTNSYDRVHPFGGVLEPESGTWSELPPEPDARPDGQPLDLLGSMGDEQLLVSTTGWALLPETEQWVWPGRPEGGPESGSAVTVGDGRLYVFGGARWTDDGEALEAELLDEAWVYVPDAAAAE